MSQNSRSIVMNSDSLRPWKKEYSQPRVSWRKQTGSLNEMRRKIKAYIHLWTTPKSSSSNFCSLAEYFKKHSTVTKTKASFMRLKFNLKDFERCSMANSASVILRAGTISPKSLRNISTWFSLISTCNIWNFFLSDYLSRTRERSWHSNWWPAQCLSCSSFSSVCFSLSSPFCRIILHSLPLDKAFIMCDPYIKFPLWSLILVISSKPN